MALMNPANYQDYVKGLNIKLPNTPAQPAPSTAPDTSALRAAYDSRNTVAATPAPSAPTSPQYSASQQSAQNWINNSASGQGGLDAYTKQQNDKYQQAIQTGNSDLLGRLMQDSQRVGYSFNSPYTPSQASAQTWINNQGSGQGGLDAYLGTQNKRYADAVASNDTNTIGKLKADAERVGYTLNEPVAATPVPTASSAPPPAATNTQPSNNSSLINDIYNNNYNAQAQKLKDARDQALAGLAGQDDLIKQNAISGLNNNDQLANQRMVALKEAMANAGLSASGDNVSAQVGIGTSQQQGANDINTNRGNLLNQSMAQRNAINNNASADDLALMQQLQAARGGQLLDDSYKQQQYGLDLAGLSGQLPGGGQTLAAVNADRNYQLGLSGLSGQLPSSAGGGQTLAALQQAYQQRQGNIGNAISLSQLTGNLYQPKDSGSALFGQTPLGPTLSGQQFQYGQVQDAIKNGMSQQQIDNQASQFAKTLGYNYENMNASDKRAMAQIAISQQNADTSAANSKADNARADNAVNLSANQRKFAGDVQNELSQAKSRDDVVNFLNANAGEITSQLGNDAFTKMKNDALSQYDKVTPSDKQDTTSREKAIAAAQKDDRWGLAKTDKNALIREYEAYYK